MSQMQSMAGSRPVIMRIMPIIGMSPPAMPPGIPGPAAAGGAGG